MDNPSSPLETLRQLKEMLDAGALTPAEFEVLKQRLVFSAGSAATPPTAIPPPAPPRPLVIEPQVSAFPLPTPEPRFPMPPAPVPQQVVPAPAEILVPTPPKPAPAWATKSERMAEVAPEPATDWAADELAEPETVPRHNPLALILSIGGLLVLLGLVLYLSLNRRPSERVTSTSQTAADSVKTVIETGPQAEPLPAPVAAETVRVRPTNPAPSLPLRRTSPPRDSAVAVPAASSDTTATP